MPIKEKIKGDAIKLLQENPDKYFGLAHGCNCFHTMGAGIAAQIAKTWKMVAKRDEEWACGDPSKMGKYTVVPIGKGRYIFNLYTQYHFHRRLKPVSYEAIGSAFTLLNSNYKNETKKLLIPQIGAGLAGGDWPLIEYIIDNTTPDLDITLVLWNKTKV